MYNRNTAAQELRATFSPIKSFLRHLLIASFIGALVFGTWGFIQYDQHNDEVSFRNALYHTAQMFLMHSPHFDRPVPWTLELGRWLAATTILLTLIGAARRVFQEENTSIKLHRLRSHTVVCGLGRRSVAVIEKLRQKRHPVVVIDPAPSPELEAICRDCGAMVVTGDATRADTLLKARIENASTLMALCPEDSVNCEIAAMAFEVRRDAKAVSHALRCHVQLTDTDLRAALQRTIALQPAANVAKLCFYDIFDAEARELLVHTLPLDHDGVTVNEERQVHLIILGFGRMGRTLAVRAAQLGHFANGVRLRISIIDRRAHENRDALLFRYARIGDVCDLHFHELDVVSPQARDLLEGCCADRTCITSLAVCFDHEERALEIAIQLLPFLRTSGVRLGVRFAGQSGLAQLLEASAPPELARRLRPFYLQNRCNHVAELAESGNEEFARNIHQAYVKMCCESADMNAKANEAANPDPSLHQWDDLHEDLRESNRQQADHLFIKLRAIECEAVPNSDLRPGVTEFAPSEIELLAEMEHRRWVAERLLAGWTCGSKKAIEHRENPNLVPWSQLSEKIKDYDRTTVRAIPCLLDRIGKKVARRNLTARQ